MNENFRRERGGMEEGSVGEGGTNPVIPDESKHNLILSFWV